VTRKTTRRITASTWAARDRALALIASNVVDGEPGEQARGLAPSLQEPQANSVRGHDREPTAAWNGVAFREHRRRDQQPDDEADRRPTHLDTFIDMEDSSTAFPKNRPMASASGKDGRYLPSRWRLRSGARRPGAWPGRPG